MTQLGTTLFPFIFVGLGPPREDRVPLVEKSCLPDSVGSGQPNILEISSQDSTFRPQAILGAADCTDMESSKSDATRGPFKKSTSGNPSGRPGGSRNRVTPLAEQLLAGDAEQYQAGRQAGQEGEHPSLAMVPVSPDRNPQETPARSSTAV
jgi:hypothetical protein